MRKTITALLLLCLLMVCMTGCQKKAEPVTDKTELANYLADVKAQSDAIKASLENDPLTQADMNLKSQELRELWDAALNHLLDAAAKVLPEDEMNALTAEQTAWRESTDKAVEAAGKDVEGGSMYALVVNMEAASLTESRVYELYELLK